MKIVVVTSFESPTGQPLKEIFQGDDLSVLRSGSDANPVIIIKEGGNKLGEFQNWEYWVIQGLKGDLTKALRDIMNLVLTSNPLQEKLHFIGVTLNEAGFLSEKEIPSKRVHPDK